MARHVGKIFKAMVAEPEAKVVRDGKFPGSGRAI